MSIILAQKCGRFVQDTNGSNSGLKVRTVNRPRPRGAVTTSGVFAEPTRISPSRITPVATWSGVRICEIDGRRAPFPGRFLRRLVAAAEFVITSVAAAIANGEVLKFAVGGLQLHAAEFAWQNAFQPFVAIDVQDLFHTDDEVPAGIQPRQERVNLSDFEVERPFGLNIDGIQSFERNRVIGK